MAQLSVRPDDLAAAAAVLRRVADGLDTALAAFAGVNARCAASLGGPAAAQAQAASADTARAIGVVRGDVATSARGLVMVAGAYADVDSRLLGGAP